MFQSIKNPRILIAAVHDIIIAITAFYAAVCLRFETLSPLSAQIDNLAPLSIVIISCQILFFNLMGLYLGIWRFSSVTDLVRILKATTYGTGLSLIIIFLWNRLESFPRSIVIIDYLLLTLGLGAGRFFYRLWKDQKKIKIKESNNKELTNTLIIGAGSAGYQIAKDVISNPQVNLFISGFIDDDPRKLNRSLLGIRVVGNTDNLGEITHRNNISKIIVALPTASGDQIRSLVNKCSHLNVDIKILPKINEIISGKIELSLLRNISMDDLLGRDPIQLNNHKLEEMIDNKIIFISGAGGSIGSELCTQVAHHNPQKLILFEICELFLYRLENDLRDKFPNIEIIPIIGDVRFKDRVEHSLKTHRPHIIFHAAAYKHVPMMESNPLEAIYTNVLGTKILSEAAIKFEVSKFIMISTDKAVNPTNVMGSTKRIAEMITQEINFTQSKTKFTTVRFGNVLGSNGSVIPLFRSQIEGGGPITVTHKDITRYFMSIPEACQLVLQSSTMGNGGEIFVLDMGTPVKIIDLAKDLIRLAGLEYDKDIKIEVTGLRPGEKLYEELFSDDETLSPTLHDKVKIAKCRKIHPNFNSLVNSLLLHSYNSSRSEIYEAIKAIVLEFKHDQPKVNQTIEN